MINDEKVLVVIVTYNAMNWADRCFSSLTSSSVNLDIYVVDNGSKDGTQDYLLTHFPGIIFIQNEYNLGFGKANNMGLQYAIDYGYDFVYLLNQDAWIFPDTIEKLISISYAHPNYGILSPFQMNANKCIDLNFFKRVLQDGNNGLLINDLYFGNDNLVEVTGIMAAHWFMPISTVLTVGGFSPSFPHYGEDDNYAQRVNYFGLKIGVMPHLEVIHDRGNRIDNPHKLMYLDYTSSICILSNPMIPFFKSLLIVIRKAVRNCHKFRSLKPIIYLWKLIVELQVILKNRSISINSRGAFLIIPA